MDVNVYGVWIVMVSYMASIVSETPGGEPSRPSEDEIFEVLSNRRRRYTVHALKQADGAMQLGDVAERVAAWEYDIDLSEVSYDERKRVYTALQQSHLPKMDDVGLLSYDKRQGLIEPEPALEDADVYMDIVRGGDIPWSEYYLGLAGVGLALTAALWVGAWPLTVLSELAWMTGIVIAFLVSGAIHTYFGKQRRLGTTADPPEIDDWT